LGETEILAQIKTDPGAFRQVFELYYKSIFGYIFRRTANFDDTADIVSETFLKAFKKIRNFEYRGISIKVWLYRIAINEINLHFRSRRKGKRLFENIVMKEPELFRTYLQEDRQSLENELLQHKKYLTVVTQLKQLPDRYQTVISLRFFEGKENREIAEILKMKEGTIKSLLSRGLEKLKKLCNETTQ